jgi:ubiquinone/menaquinone biosynthesis C-methylase UbiE
MGEYVNAQKEEIAGLYNHAAPTYGRVGPDVFSHFGRRLVELIGIANGAQLLDVAAGRGANLFPAAEKVGSQGHVTGIDLAEMMVQETTADINRRGLKNATMLQMDAEDLTFPDASFDYVLCGFAIFFFPHLDRALAEFYRVLRPGGRLGITIARYTDECSRRYEELLVEYHKRYQFQVSPGGGGFRNSSELQVFLSNTGFVDIQIITEDAEFIYADEQEWWGSKWTHGPRYSLERMQPEVLDSFKSEVFAMVEPLKQPDGIHERWQPSYIIGTKPGE